MNKYIVALSTYSQIRSLCALGTEDLKQGCYLCCLPVGKVRNYLFIYRLTIGPKIVYLLNNLYFCLNYYILILLFDFTC